MKKLSFVLFMVAMCFVFVLGFAPDGYSTPIKEDYKLFQEKCSQCHSIQKAIDASQSMHKEGFHKVVERMSKKKVGNIVADDIEKIMHWQTSCYGTGNPGADAADCDG